MAFTTIDKSSLHFNTLLYSGNSSARSLTGVGFAPSLVWIKERTSTSDHMLFDQPRGVQKYISSNLTNAEQTSAGMLTAFDSDGFSLGSGNDVNDNGQTYVAWNWKAGGAGSANTDGSINSTATSANTTAGISIIKYTGTGSAATVGHGLGAVPKTIWIKKTSGSESWGVYHNSIGNTHFLQFNTTGGDSNNDTFWNDTTPTSSVFSIKSDAGVNGSGQTYIAYCFAEKTGFSKFGTYNGNGNANGTFVYTGFKPSLIIIKRSDATGWWSMFNDKSLGYNADNNALFPSSNDAENTSNFLDIVSNGFKLRDSNANLNNSGSKYVYMAFAKAPLVGSNNVPATAR